MPDPCVRVVINNTRDSCAIHNFLITEQAGKEIQIEWRHGAGRRIKKVMSVSNTSLCSSYICFTDRRHTQPALSGYSCRWFMSQLEFAGRNVTRFSPAMPSSQNVHPDGIDTYHTCTSSYSLPTFRSMPYHTLYIYIPYRTDCQYLLFQTIKDEAVIWRHADRRIHHILRRRYGYSARRFTSFTSYLRI